MSKAFLALAALLILARPASAQVQVLPAKERLTSKVIFVVDVSGSMAGLKFGEALSAFKAVAQQPVDQMEFAVLAFDGGLSRWPGMGEKGVPPGWATLPSAAAVKSAEAWLASFNKLGNTEVCPALREAFREQDKRPGVSVVLVSDGEFPGESEVSLRALEAERRGVLMCLAIGTEGLEFMKALGVSGGVWRWE